MKKLYKKTEYEEEEVSSSRNDKEVSTNHILKELTSKRNLEESIFGRVFEKSSYREEDEQLFLKLHHEEDEYEVTKLSYNIFLKLKAKLIKKRDKIEMCNINLKEYIEYLENNNEILKDEIVNIRK